MGGKRPWFKFFPADWLLDPAVRSLQPHQRDAYFTLICYQAREGSIPNDEELARRIVGFPIEIWYGVTGDVTKVCQELNAASLHAPVWKMIRIFFDKHVSRGKIANSKLSEIMEEADVRYREISSKRREAGRLGGLAKAKQVLEQNPSKELANPSYTEVEVEVDLINKSDLALEGDLPIDVKPLVHSAPPFPVVYWNTEKHEIIINKDWLWKEELRAYALAAGVKFKHEDYERTKEDLRLKLLAEPRLRAVLKRKNGTPSAPSQFKRMATYTASHFKTQIRFMSRKSKQKETRAERNRRVLDEMHRED